MATLDTAIEPELSASEREELSHLEYFRQRLDELRDRDLITAGALRDGPGRGQRPVAGRSSGTGNTGPRWSSARKFAASQHLAEASEWAEPRTADPARGATGLGAGDRPLLVARARRRGDRPLRGGGRSVPGDACPPRQALSRAHEPGDRARAKGRAGPRGASRRRADRVDAAGLPGLSRRRGDRAGARDPGPSPRECRRPGHRGVLPAAAGTARRGPRRTTRRSCGSSRGTRPGRNGYARSATAGPRRSSSAPAARRWSRGPGTGRRRRRPPEA